MGFEQVLRRPVETARITLHVPRVPDVIVFVEAFKERTLVQRAVAECQPDNLCVCVSERAFDVIPNDAVDCARFVEDHDNALAQVAPVPS